LPLCSKVILRRAMWKSMRRWPTSAGVELTSVSALPYTRSQTRASRLSLVRCRMG